MTEKRTKIQQLEEAIEAMPLDEDKPKPTKIKGSIQQLEEIVEIRQRRYDASVARLEELEAEIREWQTLLAEDQDSLAVAKIELAKARSDVQAKP